MNVFKILLASAVLMPIGAALADEVPAWATSSQAKCLMDRGDSKVASFAAADTNCGPVGDTSRAARAFVLANAFGDVARAARSGDGKGTKDVMTVLWQTQNRSPALTSCWKTMIKVCDAAEIGQAIEAGAKK